MSNNRPCPGCGTPIGRTSVACREDWLRLPSHLRHELNRAQHLVRQARNGTPVPDVPALEAAKRVQATALRVALAWFKANPR